VSEVKHSETALLREPFGTSIAAVLGFLVAAISLLVFVFDLLVTPEIGALIVSFVVCGIGLSLCFVAWLPGGSPRHFLRGRLVCLPG